MSLVVCSNVTNENDYDENDINNAPYRFQNSLKQTYKIPANSEVSVQSVKINKSSTFNLSRTDKWFEFWGPELLTNKIDEIKTIYTPIICFPKIVGDRPSENVGLNDFIERIDTAMNVGIPHPDFYGSINLGLNVDPATKEMKGYNVSATNKSELATEQLYTADFNNDTYWHSVWDSPPQLTFTPGDESATPPTLPKISRTAPLSSKIGSHQNTLELRNMPLSHARGEMVVDIKGLYDSGLTTISNWWQIGLTREIERKPEEATGSNQFGDPENFDGSLSEGFVPDEPDINFGDFSFEVVVTCEGLTKSGPKKLKIHHMTSTEGLDGDQFATVALQEIDYYSWAGAPTFLAGERYDIKTNPQKMSKLRFLLENEIISIMATFDDFDGAGNPADVVLCSYKQTADGAGKGNYPIPMGQIQWNLFPRFIINGIRDGSTDRFVEIESYRSNPMPTYNGYAFNNPDNSWLIRMMREQLYEDVSELNRRIQYKFRDGGLLDTYIHQGLTYDASPPTQIDGWYLTAAADVRNWQCIMAQATVYYGDTQGANLAPRLGFEDDPVLEASHNGVARASPDDNITDFVSSSMPSAHQTKSLFVRLDNMTQQSLNAGVGRPSKILYHLPRFDDSGRDHGIGLFFEPTQRTYMKLNNSDPVYLNELQLSIANDDERLAEDLVGKTIICLHFQESKI